MSQYDKNIEELIENFSYLPSCVRMEKEESLLKKYPIKEKICKKLFLL
jgi:hypothetical protein